MKQGLKKFTANTQGGRTKEGQVIGESFVKEILEILSIEYFEGKEYKNFKAVLNNIKSYMKPDFIIKNTNKIYFKDKEFLILESKYKQISGSDWEKIESNFGYHEYFYNKLCNFNSKTIVILSGYWEELQKNYLFFISYFKEKYGKNVIFDFGKSKEEIYRFCDLLGIKIDKETKNKIDNCWQKYKEIN